MELKAIDVMTIDADKAREMLAQYSYERQRKVNVMTVDYYARLMETGQFMGLSEIEVAWVPNGDGRLHGHLVNGQHRLLAVQKAAVPVRFVVKHVTCKDDEELALRYGSTDMGRGRNIKDLIRAANLGGHFGLAEWQMGRVSNAVSSIYANFSTNRNKYTLLPERRLELVREYALVAELFFELIAGADAAMQRGLIRASTLSVALVTLDESRKIYGESLVEDFWEGIACDDGLRVGDPRKVAVRHLRETSQRGDANGQTVSSVFSMRYIANCFNAWVEKRELTRTRVDDVSAPIKINGTRWTGKADE